MGVFNIHAEKKRVLSAEGLTHTHLKNCEENFFPQHRPFRRTRRRRSLFLSSCDDARDGTHKLPRNYRVVRFFFAREEGFPPPTQRKLFEKRVFQQSGGSERKKKLICLGSSLSSLSSLVVLCLDIFFVSRKSRLLAQKNILSLCVFFLFFFSSAFLRVSHGGSIDLRLKTHYFFLLRGRKRERERERGRRSIYTHIYIYMFLFFFFDRLMTTIKRRPLVLSVQKTVHLVREIFRNGCYDWFSF